MTRLSKFLKFLATNFLTKVAEIVGVFLGSFENSCFYVKTAVVTFWATVGIIGLQFLTTSGHTAVISG